MDQQVTARPEVPQDEYGQQYFERYNYADRPLGRFSMYWFARRLRGVGAALRAPGGGKLLESAVAWGIYSACCRTTSRVGIDIAEYSIEHSAECPACDRDRDERG